MPLDHLASSRLMGSSAPIPAVFLLAGAVFILFALAAILIWVTLLRFRLMGLTASIAKREKVAATLASELEAQALLTRQMSMDLEELRKRILQKEESLQSETPLGGMSVALNLNRRGQILRLSRKGKSVGEIAQDLNVAQGEVELLLKVHDLSQKSVNE